MFIKLNFTTAQPPSIWFDSVYWIMANKSIWNTSSGQGVLNASLFKDSVLSSGSITSTVVSAGSFVTGASYTIKDVGTTTTWSGVGAVVGTAGTPFVATGAGSGNGTAYLSNTVVAATSLVPGSSYTIGYVGNTTWTTGGASSGTVGTIFTYNGSALTGTGLAYLTASSPLKTVIQNNYYDTTTSEIINTAIAGTMPIVSYYPGNTYSQNTASLTTGGKYRITNLGTGVPWTSVGAWANAAGSSFTYSPQTAGATITAGSGTTPTVDIPPMLTFKSVVNDASTSYSWLQISTTTFKHCGSTQTVNTTLNSSLTANSTANGGNPYNTASPSISPILLSTSAQLTSPTMVLSQSTDQAWNDPLDLNSYCYWIYISPTTVAWAASKPPQSSKVGWHTTYSSSDWPSGSSASTKQVGPFMVSQYTRLDTWNTDANYIIPVSWINGRDLANFYRNYYGLSYAHDIGWGNTTTSNNYNPRLTSSNNYVISNANTAFSVHVALDGTPTSSNLYGIYYGGIKVSFGTNIRNNSDIASLAISTFVGGGSAAPSSQAFQSSSTLPYPSGPTATTLSNSTVTNSYTITVASATGITAGQIVIGPGINADTSASGAAVVGGTGPTFNSKYGNYTTVYVSPSGPSGTTIPLTSPISSATGSLYSFYNTTIYTNPGKTQVSDGIQRSPFNGIQGASVWDNSIQTGAHTRWPTATTTPTGAFSLQPLVWSRADYNAIGGLISDKSSIYLFNGDYLAGDEFSSGGQAYSIWPLADGFSQRVGLAVPKK